MRKIPFSYPVYNKILRYKFAEVVLKKFFKFVIFNGNQQQRRFFWEKLGVFSQGSPGGNGAWIWIHANAIGEVNASQPLIALLKKKYPGYKVLLTTANFSADARAWQINAADKVLFFPYDLPFIIGRFLRCFAPRIVVIIETDIWPNFVRICKNRNIPVFVVSGICADGDSRSLVQRYLYDHVFRLNGEVFNNVKCFGMQTRDDAQRLAAAIPLSKDIAVTGNLKFSCLNKDSSLSKLGYYRELFNFNSGDNVFIAGNVHPEEVNAVVDAFLSSRVKIPGLILILAPRFLSSLRGIESTLAKRNIAYARRSQLGRDNPRNAAVVILDSVGELADIYGLAKIAFVGGSLAYLGEMFGGHNILEPAVLGVPVLFGPHMHNFQNLADIFLANRAGIQVKDAQELSDNINRVIASPEESSNMVINAARIFQENREVAEKTFEFINEKISQSHN